MEHLCGHILKQIVQNSNKQTKKIPRKHHSYIHYIKRSKTKTRTGSSSSRSHRWDTSASARRINKKKNSAYHFYKHPKHIPKTSGKKEHRRDSSLVTTPISDQKRLRRTIRGRKNAFELHKKRWSLGQFNPPSNPLSSTTLTQWVRVSRKPPLDQLIFV
jgi:hypothetical protein